MRSTVLVCALLASLVQAQNTIVVPADRATTEGNSQEQRPFAFDRVRHEHFISRSLLTGMGTSAVITQIAYRRDGNFTGAAAGLTRATATGTTAWQIRMANTTVNPMSPSATFVAAAQLTPVFNRTGLVWPTLMKPATPPAPFLVVFPLDTPFQYNGGHLLIDHFSYDNGRGNAYEYLIDHEAASYGFGTVAAFGSGCPANDNRVTGYAPNPGAGSLALFEHGGPIASPAVAFLGASNTSWLGVPLPIALATLGLPGCSVYTDFSIAQPIMTFNSGLGEAYFGPVPADPSLTNARLFAQFLNYADNRVNPGFPLTTSEGADITFGGTVGFPAPQMSVVYAVDGAASGGGRIGFVYPGEGPIVLITF